MLKILYLCAQPRGTDKLRFTDEFLGIKLALLGKLGSRAHVEGRWGVRGDQVGALLREERPDIIHVGAHGSQATEQRGAGTTREARRRRSDQILFETDDGNQCAMDANSFGQLIADLRVANPPLPTRGVVLNACHSRRVAEELAKHVDFAIGMEDAVADIAAIDFVIKFYEGLAWGSTVHDAHQEACNRMLPDPLVGRYAEIPKLIPGVGVDVKAFRFFEPLLIAKSTRRVDDALLHMLGSLPAEVDPLVVQAYFRAAPIDSPIPGPRPKEPLAISAVLALESYLSATSNYHPVLKFVRLLACANDAPPKATRVNPNLALQLGRWLEAKILELTSDDEQRRLQIDQELAKVEWGNNCHHLLLRVEKVRFAGGLRLSYCLWTPEGRAELHRLPGAYRTMSAVRKACLAQIQTIITSRALPPGQLVIELLLPMRLLLEPESRIHEWSHPGGKPQPLGAYYDAVLRVERPAEVRIKQRELWVRFLNVRDRDCHVSVVDENGDVEGELVRFSNRKPKNEVKLERALLTSGVVCAALEHPPEGDRILLDTILNAGIPIVLWTDKQWGPGASDRLHSIVGGKPGELLRRITAERAERSGRDSLSVVWDDPTRTFETGALLDG